MFTGIVTDVGTIVEISGGMEKIFSIQTGYEVGSINIGSSIACAGICLTVTEIGTDHISVLASTETVDKTTIGVWGVGDQINLERALRVGDELGGHFVTGHVDGVVAVNTILNSEKSLQVWFGLEEWLGAFIVPKCSVTIDGVSLTVNTVTDDAFSVNIIPHTQEVTTLGSIDIAKKVNVEVDVLARYIASSPSLASKKS